MKTCRLSSTARTGPTSIMKPRRAAAGVLGDGAHRQRREGVGEPRGPRQGRGDAVHEERRSEPAPFERRSRLRRGRERGAVERGDDEERAACQERGGLAAPLPET